MLQSINDNGLTAAIIAPIVNKEAAREKAHHTAAATALGTHTTGNAHNTHGHAKESKVKKAPKKSPTKKEKELRAQELRTSPAKAAAPRVLVVEPEQVDVSTKMRKPVLSDEAQKVLQLVLSGNQNVSHSHICCFACVG
jgi:hypothetical protein